MKLKQIQIVDTLNKAFQKQSLKRNYIELLKSELTKLFNYIDENQDEDYHKILIADFLKAVYYRDKYIINVNKKQDLVLLLLDIVLECFLFSKKLVSSKNQTEQLLI